MAAAAAAAARRGRDNRAGRGASNPASISNSPMAKLLRTNTVQLGNSNAAKQGQVKRYFPSFKSKSFSSMSKKVRPAKESINIPALLDGIDDGLSDDFKHMNTSMIDLIRVKSLSMHWNAKATSHAALNIRASLWCLLIAS